MKRKENGQRQLGKRYVERRFSSEALFQQAIAGLLERMPDIEGVQILQGSLELGKDLIFYIRGGFGESVLCACVVKNSRITGDVAKPGGARTILFQAEQAFNSAHTDGFGKEFRVERVYVVTPFDLPPATIESIKGRLQERVGQVSFVGGPVLFDLFKTYWPDYFADEADILERHLEETMQRFESESPLQRLSSTFNLGDTSSYPKKVYVTQILYRELSNFDIGDSLKRSLPSKGDLTEPLHHEEIERVIEKLKRLTGAVNYITEWQFCTEELKDKLDASVDGVISVIQNAEREHQIARQKSPGKRLILQQIPAMPRIVADLKKQRDLALSNVKEELALLRRTISSREFNDVQAFSSPLFLHSCTFEDCARAAPQNIFERLKGGKRITLPKQILDDWAKPLLIVGAPGYGKTSFCRWHALHDAENYNSGRSNVLPVYFPLHQLSRKPLGSFEETFLETLGKSALVGREYAKPDTKIRLYLDGLDEIGSTSLRRDAVELARKATERDDKYQIVLTSRDYVYGRWLEWLPRVTVGGFDDHDLKELVDKWLGEDSEANIRFWKQINEIPSLYNLMSAPLLATLIIMVFRQTGKLPESKTRLYEIFVDLLSGGWDLVKGILRESKFVRRIKAMVLSTLAATLHERRRREFTDHDMKGAIESTLSRSTSCEFQALEEEMIMDGLISKSGNTLQFSHQSFQEFLTAKALIGPQLSRVNQALHAYLHGDDWWKEVLQFYIGLSTSPAEVNKWLEHQLNQLTGVSYSSVSSSNVEELKAAVLEAFPEFPKDKLFSRYSRWG
jgi:hypothetical protein